MKKLVAIATPSFCRNADVRSLALKVVHPNHQVIFADTEHELAGPELVRFLKNADVAIIGKEVVSSDILSQLPQLKAISKYGVGLDNLDLDACKKSGVRVYWQPGVNADSAAEHTVGLMLAVFRNIARSDRCFHQGIWWKNGGVQLTGKKIGIVGFGAVGSRVAALLKAFRCSIFVSEIDFQKDNAIRAAGFEKVPFEKLIQTCDGISLHVPLSTQTFHLIDTPQFLRMKKGAFLINTSRGRVVQQTALKTALTEGTIAGAGLDVFEEEPVQDPELFKIETLVASAHMAGNSEEAVLAMGRAAIDGVREFLFNRYH